MAVSTASSLTETFAARDPVNPEEKLWNQPPFDTLSAEPKPLADQGPTSVGAMGDVHEEDSEESDFDGILEVHA
jgi:hypothetical protein